MLTTGSTGWATACVDYDAAVPDGTKAYCVSDITDETATLTELTTIPAGEGFIFNGAEGTFNLEKAGRTPEAITNKLVGTKASVKVSANSVYTLGKIDDSTVGLLTYTGTSISACKAYLPMESGAKKALTFFFDETTGISNVTETGSENAPIYNMKGQRVNTVNKGEIYIKNGKKFIGQ